jgi:hypothetical protein
MGNFSRTVSLICLTSRRVTMSFEERRKKKLVLPLKVHLHSLDVYDKNVENDLIHQV